MINNRSIRIPLEIEEFILENSFFSISELMLKKSELRSYLGTQPVRMEDIDIGVCGIILFLIELDKIHPNPRLQTALLESGDDLLRQCKSTTRLHFGFFKGRAGVCYTLIRLSEATGVKKYQRFAINLIKNQSDTFIQSEFTSNKLYDGRAGFLLTLLHLYNIQADGWILNKIILCLKKIINDFVLTERGIFWNRKDNNIQPLNSFLHGSSGLAFTLAHVSNLFNNPELMYLAKSILKFEDIQWNNNICNWPEYRKGIITCSDFQIHKNNFRKKNFNFFLDPSESYDLEYGATGLCMARIPFLNTSEDFDLKSQIEKSIFKISDFKPMDLSLANGISGIGSLFIEASFYFNTSSYRDKHFEIEKIINQSTLSYHDISLFYGTTGIGYYLLQLNNPSVFQSVLFPKINLNYFLKEKIMNNLTRSEFLINLVQANFIFTCLTIQNILPNQFWGLFNAFDFSISDLPADFFFKIVQSIRNIVTPIHFQMICDIFELELAKNQFFIETKSFSLNNIKSIMKFEDKLLLLNMEEHELLDQYLVFNEDSRILTCKWDWSRLEHAKEDPTKIISEILSSDPKEFKLLLFMDKSNRIIIEKLDTFGQLTQDIFHEPKMVRKAIRLYKDYFELKYDSDKSQIFNYAKEYINLYIKKTLLLRRM